MAATRMSVDLSIGDVLPISTTYEAREQERTRAYLEGVHGPIPIDASEEGLAKSADAVAEKGGGKKLTPNMESTSEQVRDTAEAQRIFKEQTPAAAEIIAKVLGFGTAKAAGEKLASGIGLGDAMKMTDVAGTTAETLAMDEAKKSGLPDDVATKIGTATGMLAGILMPGGKGKAAKTAASAVAAGASKINVGRVDAAVSVKGTMEAVNALHAEKLAGSRAKVTHAQTVQDASRANLTLEQAASLDVDKYDSRAIQLALRDYHNAAATHLDDVVTRALAGDTAAANELPAAFALAGELSMRDEMLGTVGARALESRKILSQAERAPFTPEDLAALTDLMRNSPDGDPMILAQRLAALRTKTAKATYARQAVTAARAGQDALYELWINGLLSGPQTHAANIVSNGLTTLWAVPERLAAATLDVDALTSGRSVYFGEAGALLHGMIEGAKDGVRLAGKALREGVGQLGPDKIEREPAITAARFGLDPEGAVGGAIDYLGAIVRMPGRLLMTEDAFFKAVNYRMELRAGAYREASAQGLRKKAFADEVRRMVGDPPTAIKTRAEQYALVQTFNRELAELGYVGTLGKSAQTFGSLPMGRIILPFIRTPANILHYASERTPILNVASDTWRADIAAGGARRAEALGKIGAGATVSTLVASYAATSISDEPVPYMTVVTGEGPRDPKQRATLERLGWKPYSIWNPSANEYVSYRRTDPLGTVFGIVATTTEMIGQLPEIGAEEVATATAIAVSKAMLSKTFMEGLSNFLDTMEGNAGDVNRFFQGLARSAVPAGVRQMTRVIEEPVRRDMDSLFDHWRSGLPGYDGPAHVNLWGDEVMLGAGLGPDIISPIYTSPVTPDDVDEYLMTNRIHFGKTPRVVGGTPPPGVRLEPGTAREGVKLTKEERHRLGVLIGKGGQAGSIGIDLGAMASQPPLKDVLRKLMTATGTDGPEGSRADMMRSAVNDRKQLAIMQLRRESPELDSELTRRERTRVQKKIPTAGGGSLGPGLTTGR